jgi:quinol monooxygenase YgiN
MFVVTVEFVAKAEHRDQFRAAMLVNARASREREPGCRQFDVVADPSDPAQIFLYELYDDRAAFEVHCASEHFRAFDEKTRPWVARKTVRIYERLDP